MPKRIPLSAIGVSREVAGKMQTVYPEIGKVFDFTNEELDELKAIAKAGKVELVRQPTNEDPDGAGSVSLGNGTIAKVDLGKMSKPQLLQYAAEKQIELGEASTNDQIRDAIKAEEAKRAEAETEAGSEEDL